MKKNIKRILRMCLIAFAVFLELKALLMAFVRVILISDDCAVTVDAIFTVVCVCSIGFVSFLLFKAEEKRILHILVIASWICVMLLFFYGVVITSLQGIERGSELDHWYSWPFFVSHLGCVILSLLDSFSDNKTG